MKPWRLLQTAGCLKKTSGEVVKRSYSKGEKRNSNQATPRIACQIFAEAVR